MIIQDGEIAELAALLDPLKLNVRLNTGGCEGRTLYSSMR